jgi:hypothetical protein
MWDEGESMYCNWGNKEVKLTIIQRLQSKDGKIIRKCDPNAVRECDYPLCVRRNDIKCLCNNLI